MIPQRSAGTLWRRVVLLDEALLLRVRGWESGLATRLMRSLTHLGDPGSWVLVGLALAASGGEGPRLAGLLAAAALLAVAASQTLKRLWCRPPPSAAAAWFGFVRLPKFGLYQVVEAVGAPAPAPPGV